MMVFLKSDRFQLTKEEYNSMRSQIVTSNGKGGRRYMPYVFTEQGIDMLSAVLRSDIAIQISIKIWILLLRCLDFWQVIL